MQNPPSQSTVRALNSSKSDRIVAGQVIWAGSGPERRRGLLGRAEMEPDEGLFIVPCEGIHTFGMKFAIDVAFLAADGRVLAVHHRLKPRRLSKIIFRAQGVLELAAGRLRETETEIGDIIEFRDPDKST